MAWVRSDAEATSVPSTAVITSPCPMPVASAAEPDCTPLTTSPALCPLSTELPEPLVASACTSMPSTPRSGPTWMVELL